MSTIQEIEQAVRRLSLEDRVAFRAWFAEFDADEWDRQFEDDVTAGRLDWLAAEARRDLREGRCAESSQANRMASQSAAVCGADEVR